MRVVLASSNAGKLKEMSVMLKPLAVELVSQDELGIEPAPEPFHTFVENALAKARHASAKAGLPAIADDSGLAVDALGGAPGVRSARYAGPDATDSENNQKLLEALRDVEARDAAFHSVMVFVMNPDDPCPTIAAGRWPGRITAAPSGTGGFGYDPVFFVPSEDVTAAELDQERKNLLSHRGRAAATLLAALGERFAEATPAADP